MDKKKLFAQAIGFVPADHRNVFGTDFLRMIYTV